MDFFLIIGSDVYSEENYELFEVWSENVVKIKSKGFKTGTLMEVMYIDYSE